jgi:hypothetical protein
VQRDDGTRIQAPRGIHWRAEGKEMWSHEQVYFTAITPILVLWLDPSLSWYLLRDILHCTFACTGKFFIRHCYDLLDMDRRYTRRFAMVESRQRCALTTYALIASLNSATWIWAAYIQNEYRHTKPVLDWADQKSFGRGFGLYMFECLSLGMLENFIYWCIGNLSDSPGDQIRYSALLRGIETAAVTLKPL